MASVIRARIPDPIIGLVNRTGKLNSRRYDSRVPEHLPRGGWKIAHYGLMIPGLAEPFGFFDIIAVLGTAANVPIFAAPSLVRTTPQDSAWLLIGSGVSRDNFRPYSIADECEFVAETGTDAPQVDLSFGNALRMQRTRDRVQVSAVTDGLRAEIAARPTDVISHFVHMRGVYDHWSLLCEYDARFTSTATGEVLESSGLCTYEYARGRTDIPLPMYFFTYQILNIDATTQVLMVEVLGPLGLPVQQSVYVRRADSGTRVYTRGFTHVVTDELRAAQTPDGAWMTLPGQFHWRVLDDDGRELIDIDGTSNDDFAYGMAAGFAGSYEYTGRFEGRPISGRGYIEWIDRR